MNGSVTVSARSADFQRAFVAMRYFWGAREAELSTAFGGLSVTPAAADVLRGLAHHERDERARTLGAELGRIAAALEQRGLGR